MIIEDLLLSNYNLSEFRIYGSQRCQLNEDKSFSTQFLGIIFQTKKNLKF